MDSKLESMILKSKIIEMNETQKDHQKEMQIGNKDLSYENEELRMFIQNKWSTATVITIIVVVIILVAAVVILLVHKDYIDVKAICRRLVKKT